YASAVADAIAAGEVDGGILICSTGVGISIAANKHPGIRAVVCSEPYSAQLSRQHNDTNILAFGARVIGPELAKMIVDAWLDAEFEGGAPIKLSSMFMMQWEYKKYRHASWRTGRHNDVLPGR
ncbi:ribose 5-phosphate isomerase B, partial [Salmonella enterica subsp. enterica]|nr:ribose 5-phosphate isomerase B [Salmonella enterica subsp. enterica serovar Java]